MKKILAMTALGLLLVASANAEMVKMQSQGARYDFEYPKYVSGNHLVDMRINKEINEEIRDAKKMLRDPQVSVSSRYEIVRETERYVNVKLTVSNYRAGAAHGTYYVHGKVFDKVTGDDVDYERFVGKWEDQALKRAIKTKELPVFLSDLKTPSEAPFIDYIADFDDSDEYILADDGYLYMIYQVYELDAYAAGPTFVRMGKYNL